MTARRIRVGPVVGPVFSARTWLALIYLLSGLVLASVSFSLTVAGLFFGVLLLPLALAGLPILSFTLMICGWFCSVERARAALLIDTDLPKPRARRAPRGPGLWARLRAVLGDGMRWRELAASLVSFPVRLACFVVAVLIWSLALALVALPAYNGALPHGGATAFGWTLSATPALAGAVVAGILLALAAPQVTRAMVAGATWSTRTLLGSSRRELTARVGNLEESRSRVVAAADSERRRIERDLHDGAQARLVSLAMELGRAKARFADDPEAAQRLVEQAHEEAKAALSELRSLVRGVHPPVLSDRGLDAALPGLAALCPIPVTVQVTSTQRAAPEVEAIAYFVVAEALTNVAKHSQASKASVTVDSEGGVLTVAVRDDGHGGADPAGAGLAGLAARVHAVDGRFCVVSPPGGPTVIEAGLPCKS